MRGQAGRSLFLRSTTIYPRWRPSRTMATRSPAGLWIRKFEILSSVYESRLSGRNISSDHSQVVGGGFESLLGIMARNKSAVIIERGVTLPAETIQYNQ